MAAARQGHYDDKEVTVLNQPSTSRARSRTIATGVASALALALVVPTLVSPSAIADEPTTIDVLYDFEDGANGAGYQQYGAAGAGVQPISEIGDGTGYGTEPNTAALSYGFNTTADPGYGGILWESPAGTTWDWSAYDGIQMWVFGDGSGASFQIELQDKTADVNGQAELFDIDIPVGATEWRLVRVPFDDITLATDYQPAPHNGVLDLDAIGALALPGNGNGVVKLDHIALYAGGSVPANLTASASSQPYEGDPAVVNISLNKAADDDVTVDYATEDGTAVAGTDYVATTGTATIAAGATSTTVTIDTIDNADPDGNRDFRVGLSNITGGATLGTTSVTVTIRDNDAVASAPLTKIHQMSEDFETELTVSETTASNPAPLGWTGVFGGGNVPTISRVADNTVPGASADNHVLDVELGLSSWTALIYRFSDDGVNWTTQDWAQNYSVGFWMLGTNSNALLFLDVLDNRNAGSTVDDAERFTHQFRDDFIGWKFIELPLEDFVRKDAAPGAPNDGFTLSDIHGFAIGNEPGTGGTLNLRFDDFVVIAFQEKVEDFEQPLPEGAGNPPVGWVTSAGGAVPTYQTVADDTHPLALPDNNVLEIGVTDAGWGAIVRTFGEGTTWASQDWSEYTGIGFWFQGEDTGNTYTFDILDNRNLDSTTDDAERFEASFVDDSSDWKFVELPFASFTRKDISNGAPNDGLNLTEVHGYGFVHVNATPSTILIDDVTLLGNADRAIVNVRFNGQQFSVDEGDVARVMVRLNRVHDADVTVGYETIAQADSTWSRFAVPGRDFTAATGTVTIPAGERDGFIEIPTIADGKPEGNESFRLRLTTSDEAVVNNAEATVTIRDGDTADPLMIEEFEYGPGAFRGVNGSELSVREIAATDSDSYEGQYAYDHVLDVTGVGAGAAGFSRTWTTEEDWSAGEGVGFWFQGTGSGQTVTTSLRDAAERDPSSTDWELVWADEFDGAAGTAPDPANWTAEINGHGWGNDELQYYTDSTDNAAHNGSGQMVITMLPIDDQEAFKAEQRAKGNPETCHYGDCMFTSARYNTHGKVNVLHGRVETRAQLPDGKNGIWPALWTLGDSFFEGTDWPYSGEIDIMEFVGKQPDTIFGGVHGPGYNGGNAIHNEYHFDDSIGNQWVRFALEWEEDEMRWYVALDSAEGVEDGTWHHYHTVTRAEADARGGWVFDDPQFFIMNFAIGGNFGGPLADDLTFPQEFKVDYVRTYQRPANGDTYQYSFVDDSAGWRFIQLPFDAFALSADQLEGAPLDGLDTDRITALWVEVTGAGDASATPFSSPETALWVQVAGAGSTPVSFDRIQVLAEITDATPPGEGTGPGDGDGNGGGAGDGNGAGPGSGGGVGAGDDDSALSDTGVNGWWLYLLLIAIPLAVTGAALVIQRRRGDAV